jgi:hypothetical protein
MNLRRQHASSNTADIEKPNKGIYEREMHMDIHGRNYGRIVRLRHSRKARRGGENGEIISNAGLIKDDEFELVEKP